jgi:ribosomal protein S27E
MRWNEIVNEATDLVCNNCGELIGKDTESPRKFQCSVCGTTINNPRGTAPVRSSTAKASPKSSITLKTERDGGYTYVGVYKGDRRLGKVEHFDQSYMDHKDGQWQAHVGPYGGGESKLFPPNARDAAVKWVASHKLNKVPRTPKA